MKFTIQMWPNVTYRPVGLDANSVKRLVDLEGFEPSTPWLPVWQDRGMLHILRHGWQP